MNIDLPSTHLMDCDDERAILAKLLQLANGGAVSDAASQNFYASMAVAVAAAQNSYVAEAAASAALLAELTQKTEPADSQLIRSSLAIVSAEFTRPADTTAYATSDVVGNGSVMTFSNVARVVGGTGYITNARLVKSTATTTNASFRLWVYHTAPVVIADNAQFTLLYAYRAYRLGYVDLVCGTEGTGSNCASAQALNINLKFSCTAAIRTLYGVLEAKQAYVPGNAEQFYVELTVDQN